MAKRYLLDTSVMVDCLKKKKEAVDFVSAIEGEICGSYVSIAELFDGVFRVKNSEELEKGLMAFISGLDQVFGLNAEIARNFGMIRAYLKDGGNLIEDLDLLIGATCLAENAILVTGNKKHFSRIANLKIVSL